MANLCRNCGHDDDFHKWGYSYGTHPMKECMKKDCPCANFREFEDPKCRNCDHTKSYHVKSRTSDNTLILGRCGNGTCICQGFEKPVEIKSYPETNEIGYTSFFEEEIRKHLGDLFGRVQEVETEMMVEVLKTRGVFVIDDNKPQAMNDKQYYTLKRALRLEEIRRDLSRD